MFFSPTIAHYRRQGSAMSVLCVSTGDYYGQGSVRGQELEEGCRLLGIPPQRLTLLDDKDLQDGPDHGWPEPLLCSLVREAVTRDDIDEVVTFDVGGVSGHPNHVALARAVSSLVRQGGDGTRLPPAVKVWTLETTSVIRKYIGPADILVSIFACLWVSLCGSLGRRTCATDHGGRRTTSSTTGFRLCLNDSPGLTYKAMLAHASQFVWYRRLFIIFSRYTYINTLHEEGTGANGKGVGVQFGHVEGIRVKKA